MRIFTFMRPLYSFLFDQTGFPLAGGRARVKLHFKSWS
ncbi:hypothetical protein D1AOALGA4SA_2058 [Olavius algarvensis Delta 1 endosymbiont]|nr:hypothetical protein D1AOALGA4SA_2058 [Olavius algarvensis Delta 1 endosymbiont]